MALTLSQVFISDTLSPSRAVFEKYLAISILGIGIPSYERNCFFPRGLKPFSLPRPMAVISMNFKQAFNARMRIGVEITFPEHFMQYEFSSLNLHLIML